MDGGHTAGYLQRQSDGGRRGQWPVEPVFQATAGHVLENQVKAAVGFTDIVNLHHSRIAHPGDGSRLPGPLVPRPRPGGRAIENELEGDSPRQSRLPCSVDHAHAASADLVFDDESRNPGDVGPARGDRNRELIVTQVSVRELLERRLAVDAELDVALDLLELCTLYDLDAKPA
jgi:hypothetical protein